MSGTGGTPEPCQDRESYTHTDPAVSGVALAATPLSGRGPWYGRCGLTTTMKRSGVMQLLRMTVLAAVLGTAGCFGTDTLEVALGEEFELAPNQSIRIAGTQLVIGFRRVTADSRCPIDILCVVEGQAGIELEVFGTSQAGPVLITTPLPTNWDDGTYEVRVAELLPQPVASRPISPDEYRLRLSVDLLVR